MSRKSRRRLLKALSRVPGAYTLLAFLLARRVSVLGPSMLPTLHPGERILFDRLAYLRSRPQVHDIVLVAHPLRPDLRMIKRLAGVPGDTIDNQTLAKGQYWVLGDNSTESSDSREFGPIHRQHLLARAWLRYWPTDHWRNFNP